MNLRKRSIQKTFKDASSDSDNSVKNTKKKPKSKNASVPNPEEAAAAANNDENLNESSLKHSKYFSDENKEKRKSSAEKSSTSSEDEFLEVKPEAKRKTKKLSTKVEKPKQSQPINSKKSNKKNAEKASNSENNPIHKSPPKMKSKMETDIDALLKLEGTQHVTTKSSKTNEPNDDDEDDDFEEVEMENLHEIDMRIATMSRKGVEITIDDKKKKKAIDMAQRMERLFKALSKKVAIATIKTHILCWLNYGFYLNKISCDKELSAIAISMNFFETESIIAKNLNKKMLIGLLNNFKTIFNLDKIKLDEFLNKSMLITPENLSESMSTLKCKNYLQYILMILIALRSVGVKVRLCVCFDVIEMPEQNKKKLTVNNKNKDSDSEVESDNAIESETDEETDKKAARSSKSSKKSTKRKSETAANNSGTEETKKTSKKAKIEDNETETEPKTSQEATKNKALVVIKSKTQNRNNKILSTDSEETLNHVESYDTNYRNQWLEVYLEGNDEGWVPVEPFNVKIDCASYLEKRYGKRLLYVCGYDNDNKVKDLTKRYAQDWLTVTRRLRISQLDPKKLWWERTLMLYQPLDSNLDIREEMQLKSKKFSSFFRKIHSEYQFTLNY